MADKRARRKRRERQREAIIVAYLLTWGFPMKGFHVVLCGGGPRDGQCLEVCDEQHLERQIMWWNGKQYA